MTSISAKLESLKEQSDFLANRSGELSQHSKTLLRRSSTLTQDCVSLAQRNAELHLKISSLLRVSSVLPTGGVRAGFQMQPPLSLYSSNSLSCPAVRQDLKLSGRFSTSVWYSELRISPVFARAWLGRETPSEGRAVNGSFPPVKKILSRSATSSIERQLPVLPTPIKIDAMRRAKTAAKKKNSSSTKEFWVQMQGGSLQTRHRLRGRREE